MGQDLAGVRQRRERLYEGMVALERATSAPAGDREQWCKNLRATLEHVADLLDEHVASTEAEEGLFAELTVEVPRLTNRIEQLRTDHDGIRGAVAGLLGRCADPFDPDDVREDVLGVLGDLVRHRQRGADLLYEAYHVDVSVGD